MSLIHRALDQPKLLDTGARSDFNPLDRRRRSLNRFWWAVTLLALLASLTLLSLKWLIPAQPLATHTVTVTSGEPVERATAAATETHPETAPVASETVPEPTSLPPAKSEESPVPVYETGTRTVSPTDSAPSHDAEPDAVSVSALRTAQTADRPDPGEARVVEPVTAPADAGEQAKVETTVDTAAEPTSQPAPSRTARAARAEAPASRGAGGATETEPTESAAKAAAPEEAASSISRPDPENRKAAVQRALDRDRIDHAVILLNEWIRQIPDASLPRVWLAKIHLANQRLEAANRLLEEQTSVEAIGLRGLILEKTERYFEAAVLFEHLTRAEPDNARWWLHWAINLENAGSLAQARLLYQTYLDEFSAYNASLTGFARQRYQALEGY